MAPRTVKTVTLRDLDEGRVGLSAGEGVVVRDAQPGQPTRHYAARLALHEGETHADAERLADAANADLVVRTTDAVLVVENRWEPERTAFRVAVMMQVFDPARLEEGWHWELVGTDCADLEDAESVLRWMVGADAAFRPRSDVELARAMEAVANRDAVGAPTQGSPGEVAPGMATRRTGRRPRPSGSAPRR
jgi:hypothetical protein